MMKRTLVVSTIVLLVLLGAFAYEWRYSDDMEEHIRRVNRDLDAARLQETYSSGLIGSIQAMTAATDVAGEIISTHEHVHTLKDEALAKKIKKSLERSVTVGDAIQAALAEWPKATE